MTTKAPVLQVCIVTTHDVKMGDSLWAAEHGDWLLVDGIEELYRKVWFTGSDNRSASVPVGQRVLVRHERWQPERSTTAL